MLSLAAAVGDVCRVLLISLLPAAGSSGGAGTACATLCAQLGGLAPCTLPSSLHITHKLGELHQPQ